MRRVNLLGWSSALLLLAGEAEPCGGAFGTNYTIKPTQNIVVSHRDGIETYVFNPHFCGESSTFGLILPVPSELTAVPSLAEKMLFTELASLTAPTVVNTEQCRPPGVGGSTAAGGSASWGGGATVIDSGQVGVFDWSLVQATSPNSFTEWLTANGYPNSAETAIFQSYVDQNWYFVAFKVSPGADGDVAPGATLCGDFGPIALSFPVTSAPVVPARIATVSSATFDWNIYAIDSREMKFETESAALRFSGSVSEEDITLYPSLSSVAQAGDRVTELRLTSPPMGDIVLVPAENTTDYRRTQTIVNYVSCGGAPSTGGSAGGGSGGGENGGSNGGSVVQGSGGSVVQGSGGSVVQGSGGSVVQGSGGSVVQGSGGSVVQGSGGSVVQGSGGSVVQGSGGSVVQGSGGTTVEGRTTSAVGAAGTSTAVKTADRRRDDDGCSVANGSIGRAGGDASVIALLSALALFGGTRRRRRG